MKYRISQIYGNIFLNIIKILYIVINYLFSFLLILFSGAFLLALLCLGRSIYYCTMKISMIEGPM